MWIGAAECPDGIRSAGFPKAGIPVPGVTLQVLPFRSGAYESTSGSFTVLWFPQGDEPDLLYVAHVAGALHLEKPQQVNAARVVFDRLRSDALPPDDSSALLARLAEDLSG